MNTRKESEWDVASRHVREKYDFAKAMDSVSKEDEGLILTEMMRAGEDYGECPLADLYAEAIFNGRPTKTEGGAFFGTPSVIHEDLGVMCEWEKSVLCRI